MICFLDGEIVEKHPMRVVMSVHGVGYEVLIPLSSYDRLPQVGKTCRLLIYDYVREDSHSLFGFVSEEERGMFMQLLGISGIGPKLALSSLSGLSVLELRAAVVEGDIKRLSSISGLGRKTAERMVVELKDKITPSDALEAMAAGGGGDDVPGQDALMALTSLGFKPETARKMVSTVIKKADGSDLAVEEIIKRALGGSSK